jgi:hypothetical protein
VQQGNPFINRSNRRGDSREICARGVIGDLRAPLRRKLESEEWNDTRSYIDMFHTYTYIHDLKCMRVNIINSREDRSKMIDQYK